MHKISLKAKRLNFMEGLTTPEIDMLVPADDEKDLLEGLYSDSTHNIDSLLSAVSQYDEDD